jgi:hypothetical protein
METRLAARREHQCRLLRMISCVCLSCNGVKYFLWYTLFHNSRSRMANIRYTFFGLGHVRRCLIPHMACTSIFVARVRKFQHPHTVCTCVFVARGRIFQHPHTVCTRIGVDRVRRCLIPHIVCMCIFVDRVHNLGRMQNFCLGWVVAGQSNVVRLLAIHPDWHTQLIVEAQFEHYPSQLRSNGRTRAG